jgi:hypothetical protein
MNDVLHQGRDGYCRILKTGPGEFEAQCNPAGDIAFKEDLVVDSNPPDDIKMLLTFYEGIVFWLRLRDDMLDYAQNLYVNIAGGATLVGCSVWRNSDVTVSNATYTTIGYNQENYDTDGFHDNATNNSRITIPTGKGGKYQIFAVIIFDNSTAGIRNMILNKNGSAVLVNYGSAPSGRNTQTLYTVETLAAGDYLEIQAYQSCGGALTAFFNGTNNYFGVNYLGA